MQENSSVSHCLLVNSTRGAFESKLTKSSRSTDFRIPLSLCTMFNVMVDAKDQSAKLCAMEMGQEVIGRSFSDCWDRQKLDLRSMERPGTFTYQIILPETFSEI